MSNNSGVHFSMMADAHQDITRPISIAPPFTDKKLILKFPKNPDLTSYENLCSI